MRLPKPKLDWVGSLAWLVKYRSAVGMLAIAFVAVTVVLSIVAIRATDWIVQIGLGVIALAGLFGFFGAAIWMVNRLGIHALAESQQLLALRKVDLGTKFAGDVGLPNLPIPDSAHPPRELPPPEGAPPEDDED